MSAPLVSVVIPALNERAALPGTLERLLEQPGSYEVLVVDGGSGDGTPEIARGFRGVRVLHAPRGRARQMNAGAAAARAAWLLLLHADTELPRGWLARIPELDCEAGAFRHRFADPDWKLRLLSWANTQRSRITRIFYGDQAIFVRAPLFRAVTPARLLDAHVQTSPRKFRRLGVLRATAMCLELLARHALRRPLAGHRFFREVR